MCLLITIYNFQISIRGSIRVRALSKRIRIALKKVSRACRASSVSQVNIFRCVGDPNSC